MAGTYAVKQYVNDVKEFDAANKKIEELTKQLTDSMKTGDEKCDNLNQKLKGYKYKVKKQRADIEKSKKELINALGDTKEQVAINLRQKKKLAAAKAAASEVENKLNDQIESLLKFAPSVSKPFDTSQVWYSGYGKEPKVTLVKDDNAEKLRKALKNLNVVVKS